MARARLRRATLADMDLLVRHRRRMWKEILEIPTKRLDAADRAYRAWARRQMQGRRMVGWIVETGAGEPVASGCVWLAPQQPRPMWEGLAAPYLMSMFTEPGHRGKGYATWVVRESLRWARQRGYPVMLLHASRHGERMYVREGFLRTNEMRRSLDVTARSRPVRKRAPHAISRRSL